MTRLASRLLLVWAAGLPAISAIAAPITIAETLLDSTIVVINNYTWANAQNIFICEMNVANCDQTTGTYSDIIGLANAGGKAEVNFFSDTRVLGNEMLLIGNPMANNLFGKETPTVSFNVAAFDNNAVMRLLMLNISSDLDPTPLGAQSDSIDFIALAGGPTPDFQEVPEPTYTAVFAAFGVLMLFRSRVARMIRGKKC